MGQLLGTASAAFLAHRPSKRFCNLRPRMGMRPTISQLNVDQGSCALNAVAWGFADKKPKNRGVSWRLIPPRNKTSGFFAGSGLVAILRIHWKCEWATQQRAKLPKLPHEKRASTTQDATGVRKKAAVACQQGFFQYEGEGPLSMVCSLLVPLKAKQRQRSPKAD